MLKELRAHHRNILQMAFNGQTNEEIASRLGITSVTVNNIIKSPMGKAYLDGLNDKMKESTLDVRKELVSMNMDALLTFKRLLDPKTKAPASVQFSTAKDVLDRTGFKAPDKLNIDMTFQAKTDEELDAEIAAIEDAIKRTHEPMQNLSQPPDVVTSNTIISSNENDPIIEELPIDMFNPLDGIEDDIK